MLLVSFGAPPSADSVQRGPIDQEQILCHRLQCSWFKTKKRRSQVWREFAQFETIRSAGGAKTNGPKRPDYSRRKDTRLRASGKNAPVVRRAGQRN